MPLWCVTSVGWLPLPLLVWAAALGLRRDVKARTLRCAPFLAPFACLLLLVHFLFRLSPLDRFVDEFELQDLGLREDNSTWGILYKTAFTAVFFCLLRRHMSKKDLTSRSGPIASQRSSATGAATHHEEVVNVLVRSLWMLIMALWAPLVLVTVAVLVCVGDDINLFRITHAVFFVWFVLLFQFWYSLWRKLLSSYWTFLGIFTFVNLMLEYMLHSVYIGNMWIKAEIPEFWEQKVGLEIHDASERQHHLLLLACNLIAVMVQIQFNDYYLDLTKLEERKKEDQNPEYTAETISVLINRESGAIAFLMKMGMFICRIINILLSYVRMHFSKLVSGLVAWMTIHHVSALHWLVFMATLVSLSVRRRGQDVITKIITTLCCAHLLAWMIIDFIEWQDETFVCEQNVTSNFSEPSAPRNFTGGFLGWAGLLRDGLNASPDESHFLFWHTGVILALTVALTISKFTISRGYLHRNDGNETLLVFPGVNRSHADNDVSSCCKFLINFFFYKYGVEICLMVMAVDVGQRWDLHGLVMLLWLLVLYALPRPTLARLWSSLVIYVYLSLAAQYLMFVGVPAAYCFAYPWYNSRLWRIIQDWLMLSDPFFEQDTKFMLYDVILLVLLTQQQKVFSEERKEGTNHPGGSNATRSDDLDNPHFINPVPDFISYTRSWLDLWKYFFFFTIFWIAVTVIFLTSTMQVNIFSTGYMAASFILFWTSDEMFLLPWQRVRSKLNLVALYSLLVMLAKLLAQMCFNGLRPDYGTFSCASLGFLSLHPLPHPKSTAVLTHALYIESSCDTPDFPVVAWDIVCFCFLIFTRRVCSSYYFVYIVNHIKASALVASRGAFLFDQMRLRQVAAQEKKERGVIQHLERKMTALRQRQRRLHENPLFVSPVTHADAIRAGDYFMFDEREIQKEDEMRRHSPKAEVLKEAEDGKRSSHILTIGSRDTSDSDTRILPPGTSHLTIKDVIQKTKTYKLEAAVNFVKKSRDLSPLDSELQLLRETEERSRRSKKSPCLRKSKIFLVWLYYMFDSGIISLSLMMYGFSRNYRYVIGELEKEKKIILAGQKLRGHGASLSYRSTPSLDEIRKEAVSEDGGQDRFLSKLHHSTYFSLLSSIAYTAMAHSELLVYLLVVVHVILEPTAMSVIMSLSTFLWAALCTPRPVSSFWTALFFYVEGILIFKTLHNFKYFLTSLLLGPEKPDVEWKFSYFFGVTQSGYQVVPGLLLLVSILFHRFRLKKYGMWRERDDWTAEGETSLHWSSRPTESSTLSDTFPRKEAEPSTVYFSTGIILLISKYRYSLRHFINRLLTDPRRIHVDVYSKTFFLDALCSLIVILGIRHFSMMERGWYWYFDRNRFPDYIFFLLFVPFILMIAERIIYVKKNIKAKLCLYFLDVLVTHIFLFIFLPLQTYRKVSDSYVLQVYYFIKCINFLLSAYQIRCGYAVYEGGYLFRKKFGLLYYVFYFVFMWTPFLFELRTALDWTASTTTLLFFEFFKMEDVYMMAYAIKCARDFEQQCSSKRGRPKTYLSTIAIGAVVVGLLVLVIWLPLVLFRLRRIMGVARPPNSFGLEITINTFPAIYNEQSFSIRQFTDSEWEKLKYVFSHVPAAQETTSYFDARDVVVVKFPTYGKVWDVSEETRMLLVSALKEEEVIHIKLSWTVEYTMKDIIHGYKTRSVPKDDALREQLASLVQDASADLEALVPQLLPKFLDTSRVESEDREGASVSNSFSMDKGIANVYQDVILSLQDVNPFVKLSLRSHHRSHGVHTQSRASNFSTVRFQMWKVHEFCKGPDWEKFLRKLPEADCEYFIVYIFSEKKFGFWLDLLSSKGSKAIYYAIVLTVWRALRLLMRGKTNNWALTEIPYPDRLLELCHDIYAVRQAKNFDLEEDLYAKLIFVLRSPETLIMYTRKPPPKEKGN